MPRLVPKSERLIRVAFNLTPVQKRYLESRSTKTGSSVSELIRQAVSSAIGRWQVWEISERKSRMK